jgi:hypothetical protein
MLREQAEPIAGRRLGAAPNDGTRYTMGPNRCPYKSGLSAAADELIEYAIVFVSRDAGDLPQNPIVRQELRPERIDLELRQRARCLGMRVASDERRRDAEPRDHHFHVFLPDGHAPIGVLTLQIGQRRHCRMSARCGCGDMRSRPARLRSRSPFW